MALACHPERSEGSVALGVEMPHLVTLSAAKGLSRWAARCFAALSMTVWSSLLLTYCLMVLANTHNPLSLLSFFTHPHYANEQNNSDNWVILRTIFLCPHRTLLGGCRSCSCSKYCAACVVLNRPISIMQKQIVV